MDRLNGELITWSKKDNRGSIRADETGSEYVVFALDISTGNPAAAVGKKKQFVPGDRILTDG